MQSSSVSVILHLQKGVYNKILPRIKLRSYSDNHVLLQTTRAADLQEMVLEFCYSIGLDIVKIEENELEYATEITVTKDSIRSVLEAGLAGELRCVLVDDCEVGTN